MELQGWSDEEAVTALMRWHWIEHGGNFELCHDEPCREIRLQVTAYPWDAAGIKWRREVAIRERASRAL